MVPSDAFLRCMQVLMSVCVDLNGRYYMTGRHDVKRLAYSWEISMIFWM